MAKEKKNQKFGMPFFKIAKEKVIQSKEFQQSKLKTYYTSGQNPDVGEPDLYTPPSSHWQPANRILYRPQTVWLYITVPFPYDTKNAKSGWLTLNLPSTPVYTFGTGHFGQQPAGPWVYIGYYFANGGRQITAAWNDPNPSHTPHEPPNSDLGGWTSIPAFGGSPQWYQETLNATYFHTRPNPFPAERIRIKNIFDNVKEKIEKLRPDRTYIEVIDPWIYFEPSDTLGSYPPNRANAVFHGIKDIFFQNYDDGESPINGADLPRWQTMVPTDTDDYFGVNFLYIYTGCPSNVLFTEQGSGTGGNSRIDLVKKANEKFCNYIIKIFGLDIQFDKYPAYEQAPPGEPPTTMVFPATGIHGDWKIYSPSTWPPPDNYGDKWTASVGDIPAYIADTVKNMNESINNINFVQNFVVKEGNNNFLKFNIEELNNIEIDAQYMGETNLIIDADYLVKLIAKHYKFNHETGKDLT